MNKIFSTKILEYQGHLFEVGLLPSGDGIEPTWRVEIRLLDANGHPVEKSAIVLDEEFAEVLVQMKQVSKQRSDSLMSVSTAWGRINAHQAMQLCSLGV